MDVENDLEEQLTSYHICKLPTESLPEEPTNRPIKTEKIVKIEASIEEAARTKRMKQAEDPTWKPPAPAVRTIQKPTPKPNYRLEVFTVESARGAEKIPDEPPEEIFSSSSSLSNQARSLSNLRVQATQKPSRMAVQPGKAVQSRASSSNERTQGVSSPNEQILSSKMWYQMPSMQVESVPNNPVQSAPPLLTRLHNTRSTARNTPSALGNQTQPTLVNLPVRVQPLVQSSMVTSTPGQMLPATVLRINPQPKIQSQQPLQQTPVQAIAGRNLRKRQNSVQPVPVVTIKIEDDDDDISIVKEPSSAPIGQVGADEVKHVIKLVTSVPVSKYPCEFCGSTFQLWTHRDTHVASHRHDGNYICFICQKAAVEYYITEESIYKTPYYHFLQAHLAESHKVTGQPRGFECPYCSTRPANYEALVQHLTRDHDTTALKTTYILVNVLEDRLEG